MLALADRNSGLRRLLLRLLSCNFEEMRCNHFYFQTLFPFGTALLKSDYAKARDTLARAAVNIHVGT